MGGMRRGLSSFPFHRFNLFHIHVSSCHFCNHLFLLNWPSLHAEHLPHHHHFHHFILSWIFHGCLFFHNSCCCSHPSSSWFMNFLVKGTLDLRNFCFTSRDLPYLRGRVPRFWHDFQLVCVYGELRKVEWTLLTALIYKSRCGARTINYVQPRSVLVGT
jgi:hypothetical protein